MRQYLTLDVLANLVCMMRASIDGAMCLADDDDEARFYEKCAHRDSKVIPAPGNALKVLDSVEGRGIEGVVAVVRGPESPEFGAENIFRPSLGDVASILLNSKGCGLVLSDIFGATWLLACEKAIGLVQSRAAWIAHQFADVQQVYIASQIPTLDSNRLSDLIRWDTFALAWDHAALTLPGLSITALQEVKNLTQGKDVRTDLLTCDGMDAVRVLADATRKYRPRGIKARREVSAEELLGMLCMAFDLGELETDEIFWRMKRWERRNRKYPLLGQWRILDPLGVVWDQRYWEDDLWRMLGFLGTNVQMAAFKMDLDNFKAVNDTLGHAAGDDAIRLYCSIVKETIGNLGEVYRRGGDEVVALIPEIDSNQARDLAERIRTSIESEFLVWSQKRGLAHPPTGSIGLVVTDTSRPRSEIMHSLDVAQLEAKQKGKNCVVCKI